MGSTVRRSPSRHLPGQRIITTFDKREEGFEKKFALEEEQKFKAESRRNRLTGLWVAEQLGVRTSTIIMRARKLGLPPLR